MSTDTAATTSKTRKVSTEPRIGLTQLQEAARQANHVLSRPTDAYTKDSDGISTPNAGAFFIGRSDGGFAFMEIAANGGTKDVFGTGYVPARTLSDRISALLLGVEMAKA